MENQSERGIDGRAVVERLQQAYDVKTLSALAEAMGENPATVKGWNQRGSVPLAACVRAALDRNCSLNWLLLDLGSKSLALVSKEVKYAAEPAVPPAVAERGVMTMASGGGKTGTGLTLHALLQWDPDALTRWLKITDPTDEGVSKPKPGAVLPATTTGEHLSALELEVSTPSGAKTFGYRVIPSFVGSASAGPGRGGGESEQAIDQAGEMAFSYDWLRRNLSHTSGELASIQIRGDSMAPTLMDGESIIIDCAVRRVDVNGVYVFNLRGDRLVKRVQRKMDQSLVIMSDNPQYSRETLPGTRANEIEIIGRMVWPRVR